MAGLGFDTRLTPALAEARERIEKMVIGHGLDPFETVFCMVDYRQMNQIAAYGGFPTRYPHWRHGMEYDRLSKSYTFGMHRIYELVINNDPCYAYLLEANEDLIQQARDRARLRALRLLQAQPGVRGDEPEDDGRDGEPRHSSPSATWIVQGLDRPSRASSTCACRSRT